MSDNREQLKHEAAWESAQAEVQQRNKKRFVWILGIGVVIAALTLTGLVEI